MRLGRNALETLLRTHVVELRFRRRHPKQGRMSDRRMLCTNDMTLLLSTPGRNILNFNPTTGVLPYNAAQHNLIITHDIFMQNWRAIPCEAVEVIAVIKTNPPTHFWQYFMNKVVPMSAQHKMLFMNK